MQDEVIIENENHSEINMMASRTCQPQILKDQFKIASGLMEGISKYNNDFFLPFFIAAYYFSNVELSKISPDSPVERCNSYMDLFDFNMDLMRRYFTGSMDAMEKYASREIIDYARAVCNTLFSLEGETIDAFFSKRLDILDNVIRKFPSAIKDIEPEYGFHFENGQSLKFAESDRFIVYKVNPSAPKTVVDDKKKPILIIPPFVLGYNILAFLPGDNKSYAHCFANQGIPTYIRVPRDIAVTPALQNMTIEDDAMDTKKFCRKIKEKHGRQVTLNGYCQGGFSAVCNYLSGELDGLVDAIITCVAPMDGTRSRGLGDFLKKLPPRFNDLIYGTKRLPNGNKVADGDLMGWVYKLKSIENEAPLASFFRDLHMFTSSDNKPREISKTAAALNYWLQNERSDLPLSITKMSFDSYNIPVKEDGTLPFEMFGRKLNFHRIEEKKIPWLICYGASDDLVEKENALAPLDFIDAEVSEFPKGHVAIATSWSNPESQCALHKTFGKEKFRGPVRFHLDMDAALYKKSNPKKKKTEN